MALVVYSHTSPFTDSLQLETRLLTFFNQNLVIHQRWSPGGKGGTDIGFGASVYNGAIAMAFYLERNQTEIKPSIIELGCGPGLVSLVASLHKNCDFVLATDGDSITVDLVRENIKQNVPNRPIQAQKLYWGNEEDIQSALLQLSSLMYSNDAKKRQFDLVIASDVAALPYAECYDQLIDTMHRLCRPGGTVLLSYQRRHTSEDLFFQKFQRKFDYIQLPIDSSIHEDFRHLPIHIFKAAPRSQPLHIPSSPTVIGAEDNLHFNHSSSSSAASTSVNQLILEFEQKLQSALYYRNQPKQSHRSFMSSVPLLRSKSLTTAEGAAVVVGSPTPRVMISDSPQSSHESHDCATRDQEPSSATSLSASATVHIFSCMVHGSSEPISSSEKISSSSGSSSNSSSSSRVDRKSRKAADAEYCFPTIQTAHLQLKHICSADLTDFYEFRKELESLLTSSACGWCGTDWLDPISGLQSADRMLRNYDVDRKGLKAIRWGIARKLSYEDKCESSSSSIDVDKAVNPSTHVTGSQYSALNHVNSDTADTALTDTSTPLDQVSAPAKLSEVTEKASIIIGSVSLRFDKRHCKAEIDYALHPAYWNRGWMKEAIAAIISYVVEVAKLPLRTIEAHVDSENLRSCALLTRLGFTLQGKLVQNYLYQNEFRDTNIYQLIIPLKADVM